MRISDWSSDVCSSDLQELLAKAYAQAQGIRGEGEGKAAGIYADVYGKNPEFYSLYKSLEGYRAAFSNSKDALVLSPKSEFFRSEEHTSELQSLMRISYAVFCLKKKKKSKTKQHIHTTKDKHNNQLKTIIDII